MKRLIPLVFLALPVALFAQSPKDQEAAMLKKLGLNDSQVSQVFDIQNKTRETVRQDTVQLRLLHAQMEKALLPASPNMQEVNGYISQMAQTRADLMKAFVGARVQLRQIIGDDNFPVYTRFIMQRYGFAHHRFLRPRGPEEGRWVGSGGPMMGGGGSMMGGGGPWMGSPLADEQGD
ncbi:MAG TPA: hypothetical protein VMU36_11690 [Spirochaetia bacterium]|nr:hypothetical protein [Spirochaetia bacterium]